MSFDITRFRAEINPAKTNRFEVVFPSLPNIMTGMLIQVTANSTYPKESRFLTYRAKAADMPGVAMEQQTRFVNGPLRQIPVGNIFAPVLVEFIEDDDFKVRNLFDNWARGIHNKNSDYKIPYYDDLTVPYMHLFLLNENGQRTRQYTFYEVYPSSINPSQVSWEAVNTNTTVPVEFTYHRWDMRDL